MACAVSPYIETARNVLRPEHLCHPLIVIPAHVVHTGRQHIVISSVMSEVPWVAHVGHIVHGQVEVAVIVVVAIQEIDRIECSAQRKYRVKDIGMTESQIHRVESTEATADGCQPRT